MISFDLGRTQVIEIAPEQAHRAAAEGRHVETSAPVELIALVFSHDSQSPEDARQRQALALGIDRELLNTVVLQGGGEPAGGLLPNWLTGYGFLFPASTNLALARQVRSEIPHTTAWTLGYDSGDPMARVIAERVMLNARDVGLGIQVTSAGGADLRLVRVPLTSLAPEIALSDLAGRLGVPQPAAGTGSVDDLYGAENKLLQAQRVIPLLHLRTAYGVSNTVRNWRTLRDGSWRLPNVWLAAEKP
jgi:ABC-type transport system substrate-binding protein